MSETYPVDPQTRARALITEEDYERLYRESIENSDEFCRQRYSRIRSASSWLRSQ